jgi:hypothetical protein
MKTFLAFFFCLALSSSNSVVDTSPQTGNFLLNPSEHYVYLKFDHVGSREPLSPDEPTKGLWLRLVNNCRIPVKVAIFNTENPGPNTGIGVYDEVVPLAVKRPVPIFDSGPGKSDQKHLAPPQQEPPKGYSLPEVFSTTTISPGENLLLNLPLNHVGPSWDLQIRFYFELPGEGYGSGPYSVVSFDWQDIPKKFRENANW